MHERRRIREAVVAQFIAKAIVPAGRVYDSRVYPVAANACPALNVFTPSQPGKNERKAFHLPNFEYDLSVRVDIHVAARESWAAGADDIAAAVEAAMMQDAAFIKALGVSGFSWHNTTIQASGDGEDAVATVMIDFGLSFSWDYEPVISDAFEGVDIDVDAIDPADANTGNEGEPGGYAGGSPGPDGRIEARLSADPAQPDE